MRIGEIRIEECKEIFSLFIDRCGSLIPFTRVNAQWVFHGLHIAL